jgi:hypothetical protein
MAQRTIYALRVWRREPRAFEAVFGADPVDVIDQDDRVYADYPTDSFVIERLTGQVGKYADFTETPDPDAPAQAWAEFIWTPAG